MAGYAVAVLLLGSAVLATWAWQRCGDGAAGAVDQLVGPTARHPLLPGTSPDAARVRHRNQSPVGPSAGLRGRTFAGVFELAGGMVEVTYEDTGRKVLLVGPATYFVDSSESGALLDGLALVDPGSGRTPKRFWSTPCFASARPRWS